jgi:hypothetical protein
LLPERNLLIIFPETMKNLFPGSLADAYRSGGIEPDLLTYRDAVPAETDLERELGNAVAVMFVYPGNRSPRTVIGNLFLTGGNGRKVPVGLVPFKKSISEFVKAAAMVQSRKRERISMALLAQRHPRYLRLADRVENLLELKDSSLAFFKWSADVVFREDMVRGLSGGLGLALYLGHGRPVGWAGYYGLRAHHFGKAEEPLGTLISLCCLTASRRRTGVSFSEQMVLKGFAASAFGAVSPTLHTDNTRWAVRLIEELTAGTGTIGDLILKACPENPAAYRPYRLIGDPLAPLYAGTGAVDLAGKIKIYA